MNPLVFWAPIAIISLLMGFSSLRLQAAQVNLSITEQSLLRSAFMRASEDVRTVVDNAVTSGTSVNGPFSVPSETVPACGVAGQQGPFCDSTITATIQQAGNTAGTVGGANQTTPNHNLATDQDSGQSIEGRGTFEIALTLNNSAGTMIAQAHGHLALRTINAPPTHAFILSESEGPGDQSGSAAEADVGGQCDPTNATQQCGTSGGTDSGLDLTAQAQGGAGAADSRLHTQFVCLDGAHQSGQYSGDLCNPLGDPQGTPHPTDQLQNTTMQNANGATGWSQ